MVDDVLLDLGSGLRSMVIVIVVLEEVARDGLGVRGRPTSRLDRQRSSCSTAASSPSPSTLELVGNDGGNTAGIVIVIPECIT